MWPIGNILTSLFFFFIVSVCLGQNLVLGTVKDKQAKPVPYALVRVEKSPEFYSIADRNGNFELAYSKRDTLSLNISSLGFVPKNIKILIEKKTTELHIVLEEAIYELETVFIQSEIPILEKNDTIRIQTKYFADGTEKNIGEMLNKIPGISVDNEGGIKVHGTSIEKLLIDGDDLFDKSYKILSQNMPAYPVEEVEVLNKYSANPLLKNIESSDRVAINLKLEEKYKRIWFGNASALVGNDSYKELKGNLMNFGKKNKYYFLGETNNIGNNSIGEIQSLINSTSSSQAGEIGNNKGMRSLIRLTPSIGAFREDRIKFNNSKLISLNTIYNPTSKLQLKPLLYYNTDERKFFKDQIIEVNTHNANFINTENYQLNKDLKNVFGKLNLRYTPNSRMLLETSSSYTSGDYKDKSSLIFNKQVTSENLKNQNRDFQQSIKFTHKLDEKKVLLLGGHYINEKLPQDYRVYAKTYSDLFPQQAALDNVKQEVQASLQYAGLVAHYLDRRKRNKLLDLQLGNEYSKENLSSDFSLLQEELLLGKPEGYQNKATYTLNSSFIKASYEAKIQDFTFTSRLHAYHLYHKFVTPSNTTNPSYFYLQPSLKAEWKPNARNKLYTQYSYVSRNNNIRGAFSDYILTSFKTFVKGGEESFTPITSSNLRLNYEYGNWTDRFIAKMLLNYSKEYDYFTSNNTVQQNHSLSEVLKIKNRESLNINIELDYYLKKLRHNLKINLNWRASAYKSITNNVLQDVSFENWNYGIELKSAFNKAFNYYMGFKRNTSSFKSVKKYSSNQHKANLDLHYRIHDKYNLKLQSEYYYFGNLQKNKEYYFLDFSMDYNLIPNKLIATLTGKNIFDVNKFKEYSISDISTYTSEYKILPRMLWVKLEYRF